MLPKVENCLNCGEIVQERYCPKCGQEAINCTTSLRPLLSEVMAEVLSFDSKLAHTVVPLFFRPGLLTIDYNLGKRVRYLSPLKIYLFMSIVFFLLLAWTMSGTKSPPININLPSEKSEAWKSGKGVTMNARGVNIEPDDLPPSLEKYGAWQKDPKNTHKDSRWEQFVIRKVLRVKENPQGYSGEFVNSVPKAMFFLLPLFALLLKLIYTRSKRYYVEHLVFSLHVHAFAFGMLTLMLIPALHPLMPYFVLWIVLYLFLAMRRVYAQGWLKTGVKMSILGFCYLFLLVFSVVLAGILALVSF